MASVTLDPMSNRFCLLTKSCLGLTGEPLGKDHPPPSWGEEAKSPFSPGGRKLGWGGQYIWSPSFAHTIFRLAMFNHSSFWADFCESAGPAKRRNGFTDILSECNEQIVISLPVSARQFPPQHHFGFIRRLGFYISPTIGNTVNMNIYTDSGFVMPQN